MFGFSLDTKSLLVLDSCTLKSANSRCAYLNAVAGVGLESAGAQVATHGHGALDVAAWQNHVGRVASIQSHELLTSS